MIKKFLKVMMGTQAEEQAHIDEYRQLIRREAVIGGQIFGELAADRTREFFCLDKNTWIWHEEWTDQAGKRQSKTTRYDVRPDVILKAQNNGTYHAVNKAEGRNLIQAAKIYHERVLSEVYGMSV